MLKKLVAGSMLALTISPITALVMSPTNVLADTNTVSGKSEATNLKDDLNNLFKSWTKTSSDYRGSISVNDHTKLIGSFSGAVNGMFSNDYNIHGVDHTYSYKNGSSTTSPYFSVDQTGGVEALTAGSAEYYRQTDSAGNPQLAKVVSIKNETVQIAETITLGASGNIRHDVIVRNAGSAPIVGKSFGSYLDTMLDSADDIPIYADGRRGTYIENSDLKLYCNPLSSNIDEYAGHFQPYGKLYDATKASDQAAGTELVSSGDSAVRYQLKEKDTLAPDAEVKYSFSEALTPASAPTIAAKNIQVAGGSNFDPFDPQIGLKATDEKDGDITDKIKVSSNNVDTSTPGDYTVTYEVTNSKGDKGTATITVTVVKSTFPTIAAKNIQVAEGSNFDPFDPQIGLKATDEKDGDITNKIKVSSNNVDTSRPGDYTVTYEVTNSNGAKGTATITVTVVKSTWPNGDPSGWKDFAGQNLNLINDPAHALFGDYSFYSKDSAAIYKTFNGVDTFVPGKYRITVYAKGEDGTVPHLPLKVSLKKKTSSPESETILLANPLSSGEKEDKGYYKVSAEFDVTSDETTPLITVQNYQGGYIAGIFVNPVK